MSGFFRSFRELLWTPVMWILRNFFHFSNGRNQLDCDRRLQVYVKTSQNRTIPLILQLEWTVEDIKSQIAAILGLPDPDSLGIILAGRELGDEVLVSDCDLGQQTILHAVQVVQKKPKPPLNEELIDLQLTGEERKRENSNIKAHFYVYCKDCQDKALQTGKLRVRCYDCKEGSILIHRDPCGWADVLDQPGTIQGHCLSGKCPPESQSPAEFFFKCNNEQDHEAPPLYQIRANVHNIPCLACTEASETVLVFECQDRHVICLECFSIYVKSRLNERQMVADTQLGYTLSCPVGCANSLIAQHKHILAVLTDNDEYDRYQRFAAEDCLIQAGGVLCPQPRCGTGIMPDDPQERKIKCAQCQYVFCKLCLQGFHLGDCEAIAQTTLPTSTLNLRPEMITQARWHEQKLDSSSLLTIKVLTKPCPKCRTPTERDGGCMHMECTRCQFQWCWICQTNWTRDCMASHWFT